MTAVEGDVDDLDYLNRKEFRQIFQIGLPSGGGIAYMLDAIEALEQIEGIKYVAPNYFEEIEDTNIQGQTQRTVISHDDYQNQWGLERIKAKEAYDILDGIELEQVKVGVIDTGISNHTDLHLDTETGKRFWFDAAQSAICSDDKTDDEDGHGTFVAGLISAVYPDVLLVPLKIDTYDGINIIHAILYAISQNISILNLSGYAIRNDVVLENGLQNYTGLLVVAGGGRRPHLRPGERGEGAVLPLLGERGKSRRRARAGSFAARGGGPHEYARRRGGELAFPPAAGSAVIPCTASSCRAGRRGACMMQKGQNYLYKKREYFYGSPVFM